jgi:hypothetical protein
MKKPKLKAKSANEPKEPRKRKTLNKQIAAAPTLWEKSEIAMRAGKPSLTEIQMLTFVTALQPPCPFGEKWLAQQVKGWKQKFADLLFPALVKNDIQPFEELLLAMKDQRKQHVNLATALRRQKQQGSPRKYEPSKKELGRRLRLALMFLDLDDLFNIQTVKAALDKHSNLYSDDSKIYAVMKELKIRFLQPGDAAVWRCPFTGQILRTLQIQPDGTPKESGMTLKEVSLVKNKNIETNFP